MPTKWLSLEASMRIIAKIKPEIIVPRTVFNGFIFISLLFVIYNIVLYTKVIIESLVKKMEFFTKFKYQIIFLVME